MSLETMSLQTLQQTVLNGQFTEAMSEIINSLERDKDVTGERSVTIKISFRPGDRGIINADMSCAASTPGRKVKSIAVLEHGVLKIDTLSNDARQPDLYDKGHS